MESVKPGAILFVVLIALPAWAQWPGIPGWLDLGAEYRLRYETEDGRYRTGEAGSDQQLAHRTRLHLGLRRALDPFRFVVEFEDARAQLTDAGSTVTSIHVRELSVLQLHAKLVSDSWLGGNLHTEIQFGRLTMDLGKRRLAARNLYRNTTNRFDGLRWSVAAPKRWSWQAFVVQPVVYGAPDLNRGRRQGYFWGAYWNDQRRSVLRHDLYYLHLWESEKTAGARRRNLATVGGRWHATPEAGWVYEVESAWQLGQSRGQGHFAHLQVAEFGHRWASRWQPLLLFQYLYASGDRDPNDTRNGAFDGLFGARRFELGPTGILSLYYRSNLNAPGARLVLKPLQSLEVSFIPRAYWLAASRDEWRGTGRRDRSGASGTHLGQCWEWVARWKTLGHWELEAGYVRFQTGEFVRRQVPGPATRGSNYLYLMSELRL
jgi:hypothetical protein